MQYVLHLATGQVQVVFGKAAVYDQEALDAFFPGCFSEFDPDGGWIGITCSMRQWDEYLEIVSTEMARVGDLVEALQTGRELSRFRQWCAGMRGTPFWRGMGELGVQA